MHWENAVHFLHVQKELEDKKQVDAAMDQFIGDAASGMLSLLNRYYIPMIVNMKSVSVDTIVKLTKYIDETLRQKGCNDYEIGYYLVYDQEISKEEQKQITGNLLDLTRKNSIGFWPKCGRGICSCYTGNCYGYFFETLWRRTTVSSVYIRILEI